MQRVNEEEEEVNISFIDKVPIELFHTIIGPCLLQSRDNNALFALSCSNKKLNRIMMRIIPLIYTDLHYFIGFNERLFIVKPSHLSTSQIHKLIADHDGKMDWVKSLYHCYKRNAYISFCDLIQKLPNIERLELRLTDYSKQVHYITKLTNLTSLSLIKDSINVKCVIDNPSIEKLTNLTSLTVDDDILHPNQMKSFQSLKSLVLNVQSNISYPKSYWGDWSKLPHSLTSLSFNLDMLDTWSSKEQPLNIPDELCHSLRSLTLSYGYIQHNAMGKVRSTRKLLSSLTNLKDLYIGEGPLHSLFTNEILKHVRDGLLIHDLYTY